MTHKEKDKLIGNLVDKNVSLKKRVDFLEGNEDTLLQLETIMEEQDNTILMSQADINELETYNHILLIDIRDLYKRLDSKNEDIQILNTLIKEE